MKFAIFGTGGVGAYFGGRLAQAGYDVTFIARGKHLAAIAVARMGRELGVPTPTHGLIYACLLPLELKARNKTYANE